MSAASAGSTPAVSPSRTAGTAEMIGPMIGRSSPNPAMSARRTAYWLKIGLTVAPRMVSPTNERSRRWRQQDLAADPLPEDLVDDSTIAQASRRQAGGRAPVQGELEPGPILEQEEQPGWQDEVAEQ